jgi:hypothetical protein
MNRSTVVGLLLAGAVLRAAALPLPGTGDVGSWKIWSFAAATDPAGVYGVGGNAADAPRPQMGGPRHDDRLPAARAL